MIDLRRAKENLRKELDKNGGSYSVQHTPGTMAISVGGLHLSWDRAFMKVKATSEFTRRGAVRTYGTSAGETPHPVICRFGNLPNGDIVHRQLCDALFGGLPLMAAAANWQEFVSKLAR